MNINLFLNIQAYQTEAAKIAEKPKALGFFHYLNPFSYIAKQPSAPKEEKAQLIKNFNRSYDTQIDSVIQDLSQFHDFFTLAPKDAVSDCKDLLLSLKKSETIEDFVSIYSEYQTQITGVLNKIAHFTSTSSSQNPATVANQKQNEGAKDIEPRKQTQVESQKTAYPLAHKRKDRDNPGPFPLLLLDSDDDQLETSPKKIRYSQQQNTGLSGTKRKERENPGPFPLLLPDSDDDQLETSPKKTRYSQQQNTGLSGTKRKEREKTPPLISLLGSADNQDQPKSPATKKVRTKDDTLQETLGLYGQNVELSERVDGYVLAVPQSRLSLYRSIIIGLKRIKPEYLPKDLNDFLSKNTNEEEIANFLHTQASSHAAELEESNLNHNELEIMVLSKYLGLAIQVQVENRWQNTVEVLEKKLVSFNKQKAHDISIISIVGSTYYEAFIPYRLTEKERNVISEPGKHDQETVSPPPKKKVRNSHENKAPGEDKQLQKLRSFFGTHARFSERADGYVLGVKGDGSCLFYSVIESLKLLDPNKLPQQVKDLLKAKDDINLAIFLRYQTVQILREQYKSADAVTRAAFEAQIEETNEAIDEYNRAIIVNSKKQKNNALPRETKKRINSPEEYFAMAEHRNFYASERELAALGQYLGLNIQLRSEFRHEDGIQLLYKTNFPSDARNHDISIISIHGGHHYEAFIPKT